MTAQVLTREYGLANKVAPTGRKYGYRPWKVNPSLIEIYHADEKGGPVPDVLDGRFTSQKEADLVLFKFLRTFWDESDKASVEKRK
jgi:hypothetical protein